MQLTTKSRPVQAHPWYGVAAIVLATLLSGCSGPLEGTDDAPRSRASDRTDLAQQAPEIGTVQMYRTGSEASLALATLGSGETLTLAFDLVDRDPRPLSVWFYHADRDGRRDLLTPGEYMDSFQRDDLRDYSMSRATQLPYVHYRYEFPNASIDFRLSGNYMIRVTEQGDEEAVLFERPFQLTEQTMPIQFGVDQVMVAGASFPSMQPTIGFIPPEGFASNAYDYTVCFMRNGQSASRRCGARPSLASLPTIQFYLEPEGSFAPQPTDGFLDLGEIRVGPRVVETDLRAMPFRIVLEPDYLRFPGTLDAPLQNGNPVVDGAVRSSLDPSLSAEYVDALFSLVPDPEAELPGEVYVIGSFNGWTATEASQMSWNAEIARYEARIRLKQGWHEYRYVFSDPAVADEVFSRTPPRLDDILTAFVYFRDVRFGTDRLISTVSARSR